MENTIPQDKISVCVIEPHPLAAQYLSELLNNQKFQITIPNQVEVFPASINKLKPCSVYLIDKDTLPTPLAAYVRAIKSWVGEAKILVMGKTLSIDELCQILLLGVRGYIPFEEIEQKVIGAIEAISQDRLWIMPEVLEHFVFKVSRVSQENSRNQQTFTNREQIVLDMLSQRLSNKEIGEALAISERTVRFHLANIFAKLGVHDRHSAADLARSGISRASMVDIGLSKSGNEK